MSHRGTEGCFVPLQYICFWWKSGKFGKHWRDTFNACGIQDIEYILEVKCKPVSKIKDESNRKWIFVAKVDLEGEIKKVCEIHKFKTTITLTS